MFFLFCLLYLSSIVVAHDHARTIQEMKNIDKVELHLHLGGSWPFEYLRKKLLTLSK